MLDNIIKKYSSGIIIVVNNEEVKTGEEELLDDLFPILNVFIAKKNGLRRY